MIATSRTFSLVACGAALLTPALSAQSIDGALFHDLDRDGVRDPGEPLLAGRSVTLYGADGSFDVTVTTGADGRFSFAAATGAQYVLDVAAGADWRFAYQPLAGDPDPIPDYPQGRRRPALLDSLASHLRASSSAAPLVHVALGDSVGYGFNLCDSPGGKNDYVTPLTTVKLDRAGAAALQKEAVPGYTTFDLLTPGLNGAIFDAIAANAQLVTISIGGNDFLADDGDPVATAANLVSARKNLQELLSTLESELPDADIILNTVFDNEGGNDAFHNQWGPIFNQALRDVAWGQRRRVAIAEIWPDYEHLDPWSGQVVGEDDLICQFFGLDGIHPKKRGYDLHEEKVWQGIGGVTGDADGETRDFGFVQRLPSRLPSSALDLTGGTPNPTAAFAQDDVGALVPAGTQELRLAGFDATPIGLLQQVVAKVRYRTTGPISDDTYRLEASVDGTFAPPGSSASDWNTIVPIVGSAGGSIPVLAVPDPAAWREVSALVTKGAPIDGSPSLTWSDLATLTVRLAGSATGAADGVAIEWDVAELELWGVPPYTLLAHGEPILNTTMEFETTGTQGSDAWLFGSELTGTIPFAPFGTFTIDLGLSLLLDVGPIDAAGSRTVALDIPDDASLIGLDIYLQSLVVDRYKPKAGAITNRVDLVLR